MIFFFSLLPNSVILLLLFLFIYFLLLIYFYFKVVCMFSNFSWVLHLQISRKLWIPWFIQCSLPYFWVLNKHILSNYENEILDSLKWSTYKSQNPYWVILCQILLILIFPCVSIYFWHLEGFFFFLQAQYHISTLWRVILI